ncbi:LamG-like jellyroll fold domain-containing protein [Microcoleus sp. D2_18a_B4]|uniref:LamG-like jellyroll fold domain-containing protein n=1 Tax=Microcoleus sp. D2_18a_B4 TaxID=3055329 RepID=UPI002FD5E785
MLLTKNNITHINTVTHEGKVLIVATVAEPQKPVKLFYTMKQDGFEDTALQNPGGIGWETFTEVPLPKDSNGDPSVAAKELAELTDKDGNLLLRSVYDSTNLTANAPVQLISHDGYIYIFRQSTTNTLLADRFVLDGMTNTLNPKLEVRYKRSRQRYKPIQDVKINGDGQIESVDSPDFRDMENQPFHEPSTEICPNLFNKLENGNFGVAVTATNEADRYRWHIFAYNTDSQKIDLLTMRADEESMFTVQDYWFRRIDADTEAVSYNSIPGLIRRQLNLQNEAGQALPVSNGLAVVKYDVQIEQETKTGPQLMRDSSKLMLAVPTTQGVAALSFAIAADGTLAQIVQQRSTKTLRSKEREMLLPIDLLDNIRTVGDAAPAPKGTILGMNRSDDDLTRDRVRVQASNNDLEAVHKLNLGDMVKLSDTTSYNGLYQVGSVENGSFTINAPFKFDEVGRWEVMEEEDTGLVFDGIVTRYEKADSGKLKVHAQNHKLESGDWVQIVDTPDLGGEYPILQHDDNSFTVQRMWVNGEAVNLKLESRKRRGLVFDGKKDWIQIPLDEPLKLGVNFTLEAWVKLNGAENQTILATELEPSAPKTVSRGWRATLGVHEGKFSFAYVPVNLQGKTERRLNSNRVAELNKWVHVACTFDGRLLSLLENGNVTATLTFDNLSDTEHSALVQSFRDEVNYLIWLKSQHPSDSEAVTIISRAGKALSSAGAGNTVALVPLNQQPEQTWRIELYDKQGINYYCVIRHIATQLVLEPDGKLRERQQPPKSFFSQTWSIGHNYRGGYLIQDGYDFLKETDNGIALSRDITDGSLWSFFQVGEEVKKLERAQTALNAALATIPRIPLSNARTLTLAGQSSIGVATTSAPTSVQLLKGQIADVRVWTSARKAKDIENNMHLQLTGRETDLEGYWRLGGVATDDEGVQHVYDFGVNANHGVAHGAPYGGGITLERKLGDGTTLATRYSNDELFAVSEGATYVETFEFRTDPAVNDPKNVVNSSNGHIFKPALWGRLSRTAEDKQEFNPLSGENYQFESAGEAGWHRATCRFIVPQGVRLVRCFEVSNVQGNWKTLEIRRHSVKLVSDTVTRSDADETAKLKSLAGVTGQNDPVSKLPELEAKEKEEAPLITRKKELDAAIAALADIPGLRSQRDAQKTKVDDLSAQVNTLENTYNTELNNPLNYWCKIVAKHSEKCLDIVGNIFEVASPGVSDQISILSVVTAALLTPQYNPTLFKEDRIAIVQYKRRDTDSQKWLFEPIENGYYRIKSKHSQKYLDVSRSSQEDFAIVWQHSLANVDHQKWLLESSENNTYKIKAKHSGKCLDVYYQSQNNFASIIQHNWLGSDNQKWKIEKVGEEKTNSKIDDAYKLWQAKRDTYNAENATLTNLNKRLEDTSQGETQLKIKLKTVTDQLDSVQKQISTLTITYLNLVSKANSTAQSMTDLHNQADPRGLKVQGALLPFAQAATRLHALESCTGRVTLSYQDSAGNLRQTHYDSAYGADGQGEQWLPEGYRVALKLEETKTAPILPQAIFSSLSNQITIEFWAKGGHGLPKDVTFLGAHNTANATCLRIQLPNEKGEVVWEVGSPSGDTTIDRLEVLTEVRFYRENWTHWAFVKNCDKGEMSIYRNGKLFHKNDPKAKQNPVVFKQPIVGVTEARLGGFPGFTNVNWSGQIAELRIWNVALGERELETNSLLTLSGNEPGLVAYYPMNEAKGNEIRDLTGTAAHKLTIADAVWTPCTAPIGRLSSAIELLNTPTKFDGTSTFVQLPALDLDFSQGLTIEARVRFEELKNNCSIVDLGCGNNNHNILLKQLDTRKLSLTVFVGTTWQEVGTDADALSANEWLHVAATIEPNGTIKLYVNGEKKKEMNKQPPQKMLRTSNFIGKNNWPNDPLFKGEMDYVRVWQKALTQQEIRDCFQGRQITTSIDSLIGTEYSRVVVDPQRRKTAMMMRCLALVEPGGVRLFDEQRIEELEMKWIGNAQIDPTLIGYIEGAPPLPSENLTENDNYNGATSVELMQSSDVSYSWTREQDASLGSEGEAMLGFRSQTSAGVFIETSMEDTAIGAGVKMNYAYHWQNASNVGAGQSLSQSDKLELRGNHEQDAYFPHLGKRFVPKNVGYALVTSGLADVFVSKLRKSGRMVGYQVLPVEGVPIDVNTITFMINPAYTMSGSLDGMTGTHATSKRVFGQVPEMRAQYGSLYPASYFRLQEAYDLKTRIDNQDRQHQAYFNQFNAGLVDEKSLNDQVGDSSLDGATVGLSQSTIASSSEEVEVLQEKIKTKKAEIASIKAEIKPEKAEIKSKKADIRTKKAKIKAENDTAKKTELEGEVKELEDRVKDIDDEVKDIDDEVKDLEDEVKELEAEKQELLEEEQGERQKETEQRQKDIEAVHSDLSAREHASTSFAAWQRTMESLQIRAGKRNIVNTYIWDADGGFHAEEQQFASTVEHSIGGSFDLSTALGARAEVAISKVMVGSSVYATTKLTQTMSKKEAGSKGMELRVNLDGVESRGITDHRDYPILPGEKVDRYRFMSFFLEKNVDHWHDFFNQVVDPEWLASNDEEARALRQTQNALPNQVWRVLHRVTYVERPALMGFGRQQPPRVEVADEMQKLRSQVSELTTKLEGIDSKLNRLLEGK